MLRKLIYFIFILTAIYSPAVSQVEPMPAYDVYAPDYTTYRFEKDLYSFNLIDYMYEDGNKKIWLSSLHDLKRTNGYQFFPISQILDEENPVKGLITNGMYWNDSTQYLVEQIDRQITNTFALTSRPRTSIVKLDSTISPKEKLLFYDVLWNGQAYEVWSDSIQSLYLKVSSSKGKRQFSIPLPGFAGQLTGFCVTQRMVWFVLDRRDIIGFEISGNGLLTQEVELTSAGNISIFYSDQNDNIWLSQSKTVSQIRKFTSGYDISPVIQLSDMQEVFEDVNGNLIFGHLTFPNSFSKAYLFLRDGGRWINLAQILETNRDIHFFAGRNFRKEIFLGAKNNFLTLRFTDDPFSKVIVDRKIQNSRWNFISRGIYKNDSLLYVLGSNKGMLIHNLITGSEKLVNFQDPNTGQNLKFDCMRTIEPDDKGRLWFSTCTSLEERVPAYVIVYDPKKKSDKVFSIQNPISALQMGMNNMLLLGNTLSDMSQGITLFNTQTNKTDTIYKISKNIGKINDIYSHTKDSVMLATDEGLFEYSMVSGLLDTISLHKNSQIETGIFSIFNFDERFFLAGKDGLFIYDPLTKEVTHYNMDNGLRNNIVTAIFRERKNKYWISTFYGISMINLDANLILNYTTSDGLPENEFNIYSYFQKNDEMYVGYANGVIRLNLRDSMVNYFSDFDLDHALVYKKGNDNPKVLFPVNNKLVIPPDISYFKLFPSSYAAYFIDYFYFKLINLTTKDTISFSALNGAVQPHLDAGTYQFELKTFDRYGNSIPRSIFFQVAVKEYLYEAGWFRFLILFLGNVCIGIFIYWWIRQRSKKRRRKNEMDKRLSELELQVLQAQLNPHFIFNTISAIQYYIQDHDEEKADMYLTSFSRLMRMYLDSSKSSYISLKTEIKLLTHYLDLEIMVSDGQMEAHYDVDPEIDLENTAIPTMMLQPFVENAVQHGLFHKKGKGDVFLRFIKLPGNKLLCEIEDNGIGRRKADIINRQMAQKPASRALQIINEKLEVLKATEDLDIDIDIIDKYHEGQAMGTLVRIIYPMIKAQNIDVMVEM